MLQDGESWKINDNFNEDGKCVFQIVFNDIIDDMKGFLINVLVCCSMVSFDHIKSWF